METKHRKGGSKGGNQYGSYQVRFASPKQVAFIEKLLEKKQHNLTVDFTQLNVQGAKDVIQNLLSLPDKTDYVDYATDKQVEFVMNLVSRKNEGLDVLNRRLQGFGAPSAEKLTKSQISILIAELRSKEDTKPSIVDVGAYLYDGVIYSIRKSESTGRFILWTFNDSLKKYERNYPATKNLLNNITPSHRLTLEQAVKYSAHTGVCCHCGKTLTLLKSVAAGMGAVCAKRYR